MACVILVNYSVFINESPPKFISSSKGLSQGFLLSLLLFLIIIEGLSRLIIEVRDETNEIEEKSSNGESKETGAATSDHQRKDQEEDTTLLKEGDGMGQSEEEPEPETEEEEEEEGEIELSTPRLTKTKGRKSKKEVRDQATYKDKLQGSQLTLEKLLKNTRNTR